MCALFGWIDCGNKLSHKALRRLTQELANAAEERGIDASGIAYIKNGKVNIYKKPKPAHKVRFDFPIGTKIIMGHTRMTTQGKAELNYNNHPFFGKADKMFALAHNGVLHNDIQLRKNHKLPETPIETDSYVAVQLIEEQKKLDFASLKSMAEDVSGNFTFTVLDDENVLYFVKGNNPMFLIYFRELGLFVYASTQSIMAEALVRSGMARHKYEQIKLTEGDILSIGSDGKTEIGAFTPDDYGIFSRSPYRNYYNCLEYDTYDTYDTYAEYESLLFEMCGNFGVPEEDVELLLDYGYEPEEIESMLMDPELLEKAVAELKDVYEWEDETISIFE